MKKILVTGSNGLLGQKLSDLFIAKEGYTLLATGKGPDRYAVAHPRYSYSEMDITKEEDVMRVVNAFNPDAIIHGAAMTQVDDCEKNPNLCNLMNVEATRYVAKAAKACSAHLVHISTDFIFNGTVGPLDESAVPDPISIYGQSKLDAEILIQEMQDLSWVILRTVLVYGVVKDMSRSNIVLWVKGSLEAGKTINVVTDQFRTPTLAEDLAEACRLAIDQRAKGIYHISSDELMSPYDIAVKTAEYFNLDKNLIQAATSATFTQPAKRPPRTGFIIDKARKELMYSPHTFLEGLALLEKQLN